MSAEIETAAAGGLGGFLRFKARKAHGVDHEGPCANCGVPMLGPWCYACGQSGEEFHRSILKLLFEVIEGLFHFDGRVWRTLPDLFRRPAHLTRSYLDGHRAPQIPPLRLFLVVLLAVFFAGGLSDQGVKVNVNTTDVHGLVTSTKTEALADLTPEQRAKVDAAIKQADLKVGGVAVRGGREWLSTRIQRTLADPEKFHLVLEQWSERFAFLTLPLAAGLLSLLFVFQRQFYVFDHTIFSLHSLSAAGLMLAVAELFSRWTNGNAYALLLLAPVHLFFHMRGVYRTSIIGTLIRMWLLVLGSALGGAFIFIGLLWVGLSGMGG